jgi:hypothetical protein
VIRLLALWAVLVGAGCSARTQHHTGAPVPVTWTVALDRDSALVLWHDQRAAGRSAPSLHDTSQVIVQTVAVVLVVCLIVAIVIVTRADLHLGGGGGGGGSSTSVTPNRDPLAWLVLRHDDRTVQATELAIGTTLGTWQVAPGQYRWALRLALADAVEVDLGSLTITGPQRLELRCRNGARTARVTND